MSRASGPRHTLELPLVVAEAGRHVLEKRFLAANTLRNGLLQSALCALDVCRADPEWDWTRKLPRDTREQRQLRSECFAAIKERHGLTETALCAVERRMRSACWIGDHMTARLGHVIVKEVLRTVERHLFEGAGRPRYRKMDDCRTVSSRQISPMILKGSPADGLTLHWSGLALPIRRCEFSAADLHSLGCELIHCRVKRIASGRAAPASPWRYAVQLVVRGRPRIHRSRAAMGVLGIDSGPGVFGAAWRDGPEGSGAELIALAPEVEPDEAAIRVAARSMDRSLRAANPDCYDSLGRCRSRPRNRSRRYAKMRAQQRRREAKATTNRRNSHGQTTNRLTAKAADVRLEGHGFKFMSALFGKRIRRCAPGRFLSELKRKVEEAGGSVVVIDHRKAALSQVDACGGERMKKPLRQRWHELGPDSKTPGFIQRDIHSALLASFCDAEGVIDENGVRAALGGSCQGLVEPTASKAASVQAANAGAPRPLRPQGRRSGSNESREVPSTREPRVDRRRAWLQGRIATRRTRKVRRAA